MPTISITSNDGKLNSASAVLEVSATNPKYNQPVLHIKQAGQRGGAASIRIDDPNPDIEFVETGLVDPPDPGAGKFEIAVKADQFQINGRNAEVGPKKALKPLSYLRGQQWAATSALGSRKPRILKSLEKERASSSLRMLLLLQRRMLLALGFCMSRTGRSSIEVPVAR